MQYDPEHLLSYQSIERYTIPVVHRAEDGQLGFGSGILIDIKDRRFVATAFHCLKEAVLWTDGMDIPKDDTMPVHHVLIKNRGGKEDVDIGFLEIDRGTRIRTAIGHEACTLDQLYIGPNIQVGWPIHVCGWPEYASRLVGPSTIERSLECVIVRCQAADSTYLRFEFAGSAGQWNDQGKWIMKSTPSPHGFSGGGCWMITKSKPNELYAPTKNTKLLAIQSSWDTISVGTAPLIGEWIRAVSGDYPGLREFMLAELSGQDAPPAIS